MAISETQFDTWSHQGSVSQSRDTYRNIRNALTASGTVISDKPTDIFLQGSYGNDTNVYAESDVDVVIQFEGGFLHNLDALDDLARAAFDKAYTNTGYGFSDFKRDVVDVLTRRYGTDVTVGKKAICIQENAGRRKADVIVAIAHRRYYTFKAVGEESFDPGICFFDLQGNKIVNYPKQHSENVTKKHQGTNSWYKPMVRIMKNMRNRLVASGQLADGVAPSYYIEGLLYNVPDNLFGTSYSTTLVRCLDWLVKADRGKLVCANEQYYLLRDDSPVCWRQADCVQFLTAMIDFLDKA